MLLVCHTRERRGPSDELVDLGQNFLMNITDLTPLSSIYAALDKRMRVSANAMTQCKRPRPCGQAVAIGYTDLKITKLVVVDERGDALPRVGDAAALVAAARPLVVGDGPPACHVRLHCEDDAAVANQTWDDSDDSEGDDDRAPTQHWQPEDEPRPPGVPPRVGDLRIRYPDVSGLRSTL